MPIASPITKAKQSVTHAFRSDNLKGKVFRGGAWLGSASASEQFARFARNMFLTRVLAPDAFGTMAIVLSTTSVLATLTDVGAKEALIQNERGTQDEYVGATWWLAFGRAAALYVSLFVSAPLVAHFYGNGELTSLLRVAALGLIFEGAMSARAYAALKEMKFKKWSVINHGGGIVGVITTVILSFFLRDVWALVIGYCSENAARCILSYALCPFIPPLGWDKTAGRELLHFSKGLFGLSLLNLIFSRTDIFVLAKLFSPAQLGLYTMAVYLVQTPSNFLMNLLTQTLLPTFSHIQEDGSRMNRILQMTTAYTALFGMPVLVFIVFCGRSLLTLAYGPRYVAALPALIAASCVALLNVANSQITLVFYAKGLPQLHRRAVATMAVLMMILTYPFARKFGLVGGQLACLVAILVGYIFQVECIGKLTNLNLSKYRKNFLMAGLISMSGVVICLAARLLNAMNGPLSNISFGIIGCLVAYGVAVAVFFRKREVA